MTYKKTVFIPFWLMLCEQLSQVLYEIRTNPYQRLCWPSAITPFGTDDFRPEVVKDFGHVFPGSGN